MLSFSKVRFVLLYSVAEDKFLIKPTNQIKWTYSAYSTLKTRNVTLVEKNSEIILFQVAEEEENLAVSKEILESLRFDKNWTVRKLETGAPLPPSITGRVKKPNLKVNHIGLY